MLNHMRVDSANGKIDLWLRSRIRWDEHCFDVVVIFIVISRYVAEVDHGEKARWSSMSSTGRKPERFGQSEVKARGIRKESLVQRLAVCVTKGLL